MQTNTNLSEAFRPPSSKFIAVMASQQNNPFGECQRIHAVKENESGETVLKISLERFDPVLGWYMASAITMPLHQLPLLQQALCDINALECATCPAPRCQNKIIPFPTLEKSSSPAEQIL